MFRPTPSKPTQHRTVATIVFGRSWPALTVALLLFTALIWLRLRLVTDVPRQAYAEPRDGAASQAEGPAADARGPMGR